MRLVTAVANRLARRDVELEWREQGFSGYVLAPDEYQLYLIARFGPLKLYANACECGERQMTVYLDLPDRAGHVRRVVADWWAGERPTVQYERFPRPRPLPLMFRTNEACRRLDAISAEVSERARP